ncbi:MAG: RNA polymerase sigma factor SigJ [Solirubrobacterales bacterium]|nr:RNA polymerase sigma factor SigJ [Solirubrobacterales bacterium]
MTSLAYRLLGSLAEAEDAVQEGYARWYGLSDEQRAAVASPAAWLTTVINHICLDALGSARSRREQYIGPWLPEPLSAGMAQWVSLASDGTSSDPLDRVSLDESLSMALLAVLERLTPAERVAFVLHDVFGYPFAEIAEITGRTAGACRQLAHSARRHVHTMRRQDVASADLARAVAAFKAAWEAGDLASLIARLDPAVTATIDGGGQVSAAPVPLADRMQIAQFFLDVHRRQPDLKVRSTIVNGAPGIVAENAHHQTLAVVSFASSGDRITDVWVVRNPDKLTTWNPPS